MPTWARMLTPKKNRVGGLAILLLLFAGMAHGEILGRGGQLRLPDFGDYSSKSAVVSKVELEFTCMGIGGITSIPDGWETRILPHGENYLVRIERMGAESWLAQLGIPERFASNKAVSAIRLQTIFRGQWSDCADARLTVSGSVSDASGASGSFMQHYRTEGFFNKWIPAESMGLTE